MINFARAGSTGTITLSRPKVNAMDLDFVAAFDAALDQAEAAGLTALIIRSDQRAFCAGADLGLIQSLFTKPGGTQEMVAYVKELHRVFFRLEAMSAVTIAAINGPALGGGLELSLSCDLRVASTKARLGLPEARVGMIPGAGGTQRLTRLCGPGVASRLILGCDVVDGAEAHRLGIVQWVVEPDALDAKAQSIADSLSGLSRPALLASKDCIFAYLDPDVDGYARELEKPLTLMETEEARNLIKSFFS
jgi:enoyl-CoA hydratase/carnithine racemase